MTLTELKPTQPSLLVLAGYGSPLEWGPWRDALETMGFLCPIETAHADAAAWRRQAILRQCSVALLVGIHTPFSEEKEVYPIRSEKLHYGLMRVADQVLVLAKGNKTALLLKNRFGHQGIGVSL